jgi:hypothetical protein
MRSIWPIVFYTIVFAAVFLGVTANHALMSRPASVQHQAAAPLHPADQAVRRVVSFTIRH